jgi:RimJ/RimL family protein N-acetyltransferase
MIRIATLCLYERKLEVPISPGPLPPGVELSVVDSPAGAGGAGPWPGEAERRIREGQVCAAIRHGREVIAYCWLTTEPEWVAEIGRLVVPAPDEVYLYDAFTSPAWRGRGLFQAMLMGLLEYSRAQGRRRALIFVLRRNLASRRAIERTGFKLFLAVSRVKVWNLRGLWFRGPRTGRQQVTLVRSQTGVRPRAEGPGQRAGSGPTVFP